jgi:DNA polymerase delta subunit 1
MEKIYEPYLLMGKKRYAGNMYTRDKNGNVVFDYMDAKGIELVRRDNCPHAKDVQAKVLDALMNHIDPEKAVMHLESHLQRIVNDEIPFEQYIMSKSLRKSYKNDDLVHVRVVKKIAKRTPGREPQPGDRVPYVLVEVNDEKAKASDRAEDPGYAQEHNIKVDRLYYVEHQIEKSVCALLNLAVPFRPEDIFIKPKAALLRQRRKIKDISLFMCAKPSSAETTQVCKPLDNDAKNNGESSSSSTFETYSKRSSSNQEKPATTQKSLMGFMSKPIQAQASTSNDINVSPPPESTRKLTLEEKFAQMSKKREPSKPKSLAKKPRK